MKAKIGISVGLFGAALYFLGLIAGYWCVVLLTGYILLVEDNEWLRKTSVKVIALMVIFDFAIIVVNFIPNVIGFIDSFVSIFNASFYVTFISKLAAAIVNALEVIQTVIFIILGLKALNQGTISVPVVDRLIEKYM